MFKSIVFFVFGVVVVMLSDDRDVEDDLLFYNVITTYCRYRSYGGDEQENGGYCNRTNINIKFGKVSLLGVIFFVSGDKGAACEDGCDDYNEFAPSLPATSQLYLQLVVQWLVKYKQTLTWTDSGGGFSTFLTCLLFQDNLVHLEFFH